MITVDQPLPESVRSLGLVNPPGEKVAVEDIIEAPVSVFVFLRHFGCLACREHVSLWKPRIDEFTQLGAKVIFIGNGDAEHLRGFVEKTKLGGTAAAIYTDPDQRFYSALALTNSVGSVISPTAMFNALRAMGRGHMQTSLEGDPMQQGGVLILNAEGKPALIHREAQLGDYLPIDDALAKVKELIAS